jgi:Fe-Mn family superoxide dismutase
MPFTLAPLPYEYSALEPFIDAQTMTLHHDKHHQTYVDKLNAVIEKYPQLAEHSLEQLLGSLSSLEIPEADQRAIRNHGGGHANHTFFWSIMGPTKEIDAALVAEIEQRWPMEEFKKAFSEQALAIFGSGWMWLVRNQDGALEMYATGQQDSPLMKGYTPLIGLDVWEHAYYLKYQNRRAEYIENWWKILKLLP